MHRLFIYLVPAPSVHHFGNICTHQELTNLSHPRNHSTPTHQRDDSLISALKNPERQNPLLPSPLPHPPKKTIPLYNGRSIPTTPAPKTVTHCALKWDPVKHPTNGGCDRCLHFASAKEVKQFEETGHHFRIIRSRGGCGHNCSFFPRREDENCVRLCRKCFYDTHELKRW